MKVLSPEVETAGFKFKEVIIWPKTGKKEFIEYQRENAEKIIRKLDYLHASREDLRINLVRKKVKGVASSSIVAVDSAYKLRKDILGRVEYLVVGVASWPCGHEAFGLYCPDLSAILYAESFQEDRALLEVMGVIAELKLLSMWAEKFNWILSDGSLFSMLIRLKVGLEVATKKKNVRIYNDTIERILTCKEDLENLLERENLIALPKFSSKREFQTHVSTFWQHAGEYTDYELANILLDKGEYVDLSVYVDRKEIQNIINGLRRLGFMVRESVIDKLHNLSLFYVKGADGVAHRVEFFGVRDEFPADTIYAQSLSGTSELVLISEADKTAKKYLDLFFPDQENFFDKYR